MNDELLDRFLNAMLWVLLPAVAVLVLIAVVICVWTLGGDAGLWAAHVSRCSR